MIASETMKGAELTDTELVAESRTGNREAFRQIVERYQTLISSLAYCATGDISQSEDLAQETFVTAWKKLAELREPAKLRSWLCGITRFLVSREFRRRGHEPICDAEPLDPHGDWTSSDPTPPEHVMSQEELAILWRSVERIPETYREPLVLYYREHRSIETVARDLGMSEDAVKQRLSRGRKLLQEQVLSFIEGALERTRPQKAFTLAVLASLPALTLSAQAAAAGAALKGGVTAKAAGATSLLAAFLAPLIVFLPNYVAYRVNLAAAHTDDERAGIKLLYGRVAVISLLLFSPLASAVIWVTWRQLNVPILAGLLAGCLALVFIPTMLAVTVASNKKARQYYRHILAEDFHGVLPAPAWEYRSRATLFGLPLVHIRAGDRFAILRPPVKAWIAVGHSAFGGLFAMGGLAIAPIAVGGLSIGLLSFGGLAIGGVCLGAMAVGIWPVFGALIIGWQAFNGCFALGWNAAVGVFAWAHDFALGQFVSAAQANSDPAREFVFRNGFFQAAEFIHRHWIWLNLFWVLPFTAMWAVARRRPQATGNA